MTDTTKTNGPQSPVAPDPLLKVAGSLVKGRRVQRITGKRTGYHRRRPKPQPLIIAAWNVRTLLDRKASNRPERRTALVTRELNPPFTRGGVEPTPPLRFSGFSPKIRRFRIRPFLLMNNYSSPSLCKKPDQNRVSGVREIGAPKR